MRKKKEHHEEHVDETWLIPYADMLTLLLALFIVMFAMGQTDKAKLQAISQQFNIIFAGGSGVMDRDGDSVIPMESSGTGESPSQVEEDKMTEIKKMLEQQIEKEGFSDKVKVDLNEGDLSISLQDTVLFNSGDADILPNLSPLLLDISKMLNGLDNEIQVIGHSDNVPIRNAKYRSNWDLSAMRAINVMNFMTTSGGVRPEKVSIQAYAQYEPKFSNDTEEGRAKNRRVEISVARRYPANSEVKKAE